MYHIDREDIQGQLRNRGIDPDHIKSLHIKLQTGELDHSSFVIDEEKLTTPKQTDVDHYEDINQVALKNIGAEALKNDELLVFWLNGGAATRYFDGSKVSPDEYELYKQDLDAISNDIKTSPKGITPVHKDMSYLELKIRNLLKLTKQHKLAVHPHILLMNSFITDEATRTHLKTLFKKYPALDPDRFHFVVQQPTIPRFSNVKDLKNVDVFVNSRGNLSYAPCGHGDFIYLLQDYLRNTRVPNIKYMFFANIDNLGSTITPDLLGYHIAHQQGRTVELAAKEAGDKGGAPCFVDNELIIVEQMKFPKQFDQSTIPWFNTNTFWFTIQNLLEFNEDLPLVLAEKTIGDNDVIQLEHFACDVNISSKFIVVPRVKRFWPVKRYVDLLIYKDAAHPDALHKEFTQLLQRSYDIEID